MEFHVRKRIRFSHCDPAGIVFYPRYLELCNEVVEDWFRDGLDVSFRTLQEEHHLTVPVVHLEVEFLAPSRYGDTVEFRLGVMAIGNSSLQLHISGWAGAQERLRILLKSVVVSTGDLRPVTIDAEWRERFGAYLHSEEQGGMQ